MFLIALIRYIRGYVRFSVRACMWNGSSIFWPGADCHLGCQAAGGLPFRLCSCRPLPPTATFGPKGGRKTAPDGKARPALSAQKLSRRRGLVVDWAFYPVFIYHEPVYLVHPSQRAGEGPPSESFPFWKSWGSSPASFAAPSRCGKLKARLCSGCPN